MECLHVCHLIFYILCHGIRSMRRYAVISRIFQVRQELFCCSESSCFDLVAAAASFRLKLFRLRAPQVWCAIECLRVRLELNLELISEALTWWDAPAWIPSRARMPSASQGCGRRLKGLKRAIEHGTTARRIRSWADCDSDLDGQCDGPREVCSCSSAGSGRVTVQCC